MENKFKIISLVVLGASVLFSTCKKETDPLYDESLPTADFKMDKGEYAPGDIVHLTNTSSNAETYKWTFPNGATSNNKDELYYTTLQTGNLPIKLEAISKSGLKRDYTVKLANVKIPNGKVTIHGGSTSMHGSNISVFIDNVAKGTFDWPSSPASSCGQSGYPTFELTPGAHQISAQRGFSTLTMVVTISPNGCIVQGF